MFSLAKIMHAPPPWLLCSSPAAGDGYRSVKVPDFVSGCAIRAAPGGAEVVALYFEDSGVSEGGCAGRGGGHWGLLGRKCGDGVAREVALLGRNWEVQRRGAACLQMWQRC